MFDFDPESAELMIYDDIGPAWLGMIDAATVRSALKEMSGKRVTVRINSPGGDVDEGVTIFNALRRHEGGVDTVVDGLAASMGSYLMMAGESRTIARNARVMIHDPWTIAIGNALELRKTADMLDKYSGSLIPDYAEASGKSEDDIVAIMSEETWYTAKEALAEGFATSIDGEGSEPVQVAEGRFAKTPRDLVRGATAGSRTPYPVMRERMRNLVGMYPSKS